MWSRKERNPQNVGLESTEEFVIGTNITLEMGKVSSFTIAKVSETPGLRTTDPKTFCGLARYDIKRAMNVEKAIIMVSWDSCRQQTLKMKA